MKKAVSFYTDRKGRKRSITKGSQKRKRSSTSTGHLYQYGAKKGERERV